MTDLDFKNFCERGFCTEDDLFDLTLEQMELVANTDLRVKSQPVDRREKQRKVLQNNKA